MRCLLDDNLGRADAAAGAAGNTSVVGNGWQDARGGVWSLSGGVLYGLPDSDDASPWQRDRLHLTGVAAWLDQRVVCTVGPVLAGMVPFLLLRSSGTNTHYILSCGIDGVNVFARVGGSLVGAVPLATAACAWVDGHTYEIDCTATGSSPTTLTITVTDLSDGSTAGTVTTTDSASGLQVAAGVALDVNFRSSRVAIPFRRVSVFDPTGAGATKRVVCDGNSLTFGTAAYGRAAPYPTQLACLLGSEWDVRNVGVSGQTWTQMLADYTAQVAALYDPTLAANVLVAWEDRNDVVVNAASAATAYAHGVTYCQGGRATGFRVVVGTPGYSQQGDEPGDWAATWAAVVAARRANWRAHADGFVDVAGDAAVGNGAAALDRAYYNADKVHLTDAGYARLAGLFAQGVLSATTGGLSGVTPSAAEIRAAVGLAAASLDATLGGLATGTALAAVHAKTTNLPASPAASTDAAAALDARNLSALNVAALLTDAGDAADAAGSAASEAAAANAKLPADFATRGATLPTSGTVAVTGAAMTLTSAYNPAKTAAQAGDAMNLATGAITASKVAAGALAGKGDWSVPDDLEVTVNPTTLDAGAVAAIRDGLATADDLPAVDADGKVTTANPALQIIVQQAAPITVVQS